MPARGENPEAGTAAPEVIIDFECENDLLYVNIANVGASSAHGISIEFDKEIRDCRDRPLSELRACRRIGFMPPGKNMRLFVDRFSAYLARKQPLRVVARVSYLDRAGKRYDESIRHDLSIYRGALS
jgi:hypothetical protein